MIKLLEFIKENKFVLYKDGKWYSTKDFPAIFYKETELIKLFEQSVIIGQIPKFNFRKAIT